MNRVNSNTPLQALELLNDPIFVEAARVFAQNILAKPGATLDQRIDWAFDRALSRPADLRREAHPERALRQSPDSLHDCSRGRPATDPRRAIRRYPET